MRTIPVVTILALLCFTAPAHSDSPYKGGLNYTAVGKQSSKEQKILKHKSITASRGEQAAEETPASKVWKKYKALATGTYEDEAKKPEEESADAAPEEAPEEAEATEAPQEKSGIAALLDKYQQKKEQRGQLRTVKAPPKPEIRTTKVEKAETEETDPEGTAEE